MNKYFSFLFHKKQYSSSGSLSTLAWRKFKKNRTALSALVFIFIICLISIAGYLITPDKSPYANEQNLLLASFRPMHKVKTLRICKNQLYDDAGTIKLMLFGVANRYRYIPISDYTIHGDSIQILEYLADTDSSKLSFHLVDVCYALVENEKITATSNGYTFRTIDNQLVNISKENLIQKIKKSHIQSKIFWLGTDRFGRDVLSQLIIGARVSLAVGFISVAISLLIGIFLGAIAGYFGGKTDAFISWLINVVWAVPTLLLVIAITFALGKGFWQVFIAVGLTMWVEVARVVRGQFISMREKEYVEAAKALGYKHLRIIFHHILPNSMAPVIVISAANFASAILLEAGLSFLGIGVQPPMPSWGGMIKENYASIILDYAYLAILPGLAIMLLVLAFMLLGNGLRDAMDVKTAEK